MSLRLLEPGLCSLVVDAGRPRTRSLGVPVGGAADVSALALGNAMLGNPADAAALEITLVGPVLQAAARVGAVVCGAPFPLGSGRQRLVCNQSFTLEAGEELHLGATRHGARAYLCVVGGLQGPVVLHSRSSLAPLQRNQEIPCGESSIKRRALRECFPWPLVPALGDALHGKERTLRILPGPEADWFPDGTGALRGARFMVRPESNRMGLRLAGPALAVPAREMVSQPVAPGAIQVTRDGQPILLGVDGQTIGGYPRIGHVISADLDLLGQLRPGDSVRFQPVALPEAERLGREKRELLRRWCLRLRAASSEG
jgi:biotin-dependent carboxylase-like uncharacterized protein